jgi:uncharacterized protein YraI
MVNLREGPSSVWLVKGIIPDGAEVLVTGAEQSGYLPVSYEKQEGWALGDYLRVEALAWNLSGNDSGPTSNRALLGAGSGEATGEATTVEIRNMREGPGPDFAVLREIPADTTVTAFDEQQGLYRKVQAGDEIGWVRSIYLDGVPAILETPSWKGVGGVGGMHVGQRAVLAAQMNLRAGPDEESERVAIIEAGSRVDLTGKRSGEHVEVTLEQTGWIYGRLLNLPSVPAPGMPGFLPVLMYHSIQETPREYEIAH